METEAEMEERLRLIAETNPTVQKLRQRKKETEQVAEVTKELNDIAWEYHCNFVDPDAVLNVIINPIIEELVSSADGRQFGFPKSKFTYFLNEEKKDYFETDRDYEFVPRKFEYQIHKEVECENETELSSMSTEFSPVSGTEDDTDEERQTKVAYLTLRRLNLDDPQRQEADTALEKYNKSLATNYTALDVVSPILEWIVRIALFKGKVHLAKAAPRSFIDTDSDGSTIFPASETSASAESSECIYTSSSSSDPSDYGYDDDYDFDEAAHFRQWKIERYLNSKDGDRSEENATSQQEQLSNATQPEVETMETKVLWIYDVPTSLNSVGIVAPYFEKYGKTKEIKVKRELNGF